MYFSYSLKNSESFKNFSKETLQHPIDLVIEIVGYHSKSTRGILTQTSKPQRIKSDRAVVLRLQTNKTLEQRIPVDFTLSN